MHLTIFLDTNEIIAIYIFIILAIVIIALFGLYFLSLYLKAKKFKNVTLKKQDFERKVLINFKNDTAVVFNIKNLKKKTKKSLDSYLDEFDETKKLYKWLVKFVDEPIEENKNLTNSVRRVLYKVKKNKSIYLVSKLFVCSNVDYKNRGITIEEKSLSNIPFSVITEKRTISKKIIYNLTEIKEAFKTGNYSKAAFYIIKFNKKTNIPCLTNFDELRYLVLNIIAEEKNITKTLFYLPESKQDEIIFVDNRSNLPNESYGLCSNLELLKNKIEKSLEIYGLTENFDYYIYASLTKDLDSLTFENCLNTMYKVTNLDKNEKKKYTIYDRKQKNNLNIDNYRLEVLNVIRSQKITALFRPIVHIANTRVITLGYMSFLELNNSIFTSFDQFKKYAIKYDKKKEVFSIMIQKVITVFKEEKEGSSKLLLNVGVDLIDIASKNLSHYNDFSNNLILGFNVSELIDNENNETLIKSLKNLKEKGFEIALFLYTDAYNLKDKTYRLFDYFFFDCEFGDNVKVSSPNFIKATMDLGRLSKFSTSKMVSYDSKSLPAVEMLVKSGIEYFSSDAIAPKKPMPTPVDKKIIKKLLNMYKGDNNGNKK
ncbi:MAG: hypothetical protein IAC58_05985 [Firmicutes bacterium]|uniref:EAL domain-containing protein n=1 Tax=Candidatus Onthovivens merdipullorum TaxID=2840889 RepID=A0A9D9DI07_9BACL|nr:hypothetical protein [Candidatus Onthovivens merdipullorum]